MLPSEFERLERIDREHWFYRGKRDIVRHWILCSIHLGPEDVLVDAGVGTGVWLQEMAARCRVIGLECSPDSLRLARPRIEGVGGTALETTLDNIPLPDAFASVVTALDVLEHLDDDARALAELVRITRPGGLVVITVPALRALWSDWDVTLGHRRRYHLPELLRLVQRFDVDVVHCAYFNSWALPAIALVRWLRKVRPLPPQAERPEDRVPPPWLNRILHRLLVVPACWGWLHPPLGVSILAVLRKRVAR